MGGKSPRCHFTRIYYTIDQLIDKTAFSFSQFSNCQICNRIIITAIRIFHNFTITCTFIFQIIGSFYDFPFIIQLLFSSSDQHLFMFFR